jgi:hypothetical protein
VSLPPPTIAAQPTICNDSADLLQCAVDMGLVDVDEDESQRLINEEYKTWKKNAPFLYDMILR